MYYGPDQTVAVPAGYVDEEFRDVVKGLITRLTAKEAPRKVPSAAECRFCPIPGSTLPGAGSRIEKGNSVRDIDS